MILNILSWIAFGAIVGWIASLAMRDQESQNISGIVAMGILGALIGGSLITSITGMSLSEFNSTTLITSIFGSLITIGLVSGFRRV